MKPIPTLLCLSLQLASGAVSAHECVFNSGLVYETEYPCTPALVERFSQRLLALYPEIRTINTSPDYLMGLYTFAMTACNPKFAAVTPEQIGEGSEPFFPRAMAAAMAKAAREVICPVAV